MPTLNHKIAGSIPYTVNPNGTLNLLGGWADFNIRSVFIPQLKGVPTYGKQSFSGNVPFFKDAIPQLKAAFEAIELQGLTHFIKFWDGSFVPRMKRGSKTSPSNHTAGTAFDINAAWNPFRRPIAKINEYGTVIPLLPTFRDFGFECGADWKNTPDGMHFEILTLLTQPVIDTKLTKYRKLGKTAQIVKDPDLLIVNDIVIPNARLVKDRWVAPGLSLTSVLGLGAQEVPVAETLARLGLMVDRSKTGDHRADKGRFYLYAYPEKRG